MQIKNIYTLSLKIIVIMIISAAVFGGGMIYVGVKSIGWGMEKYQDWRSEKHAGFFNGIEDIFKKNGSQNVQPIKVVDEQSQVIEVVKKASPAVVSIVATAEIPTFENYFDVPSGVPQGFEEFFGVPRRRQNGTQEQKIGAGTGFLVSSDGYIVTNKHVVSEKDADYTVYLNDEANKGEKIKAQVVARDPKNDLAVLKIDKKICHFWNFPIPISCKLVKQLSLLDMPLENLITL